MGGGAGFSSKKQTQVKIHNKNSLKGVFVNIKDTV